MDKHKGMNTQFLNTFNSIQVRLVITFLISAVLILALVLFFNQSIQARLVQEADTSLLTEANVIARRLDEFNRRSIQAFQVASQLPIFTNFVQHPDEVSASERDNVRASLDSLVLAPWSQFNPSSFALLDSRGMNVMDTVEANIGADESLYDYFQQPMVTGLPHTSPIYYHSNLGGIYYYYGVPIRLNTEPVLTVGVLRARIAVSTLQDIIFQAERESQNSVHIMLIDVHLTRLADTQYTDLLFRSIDALAPDTVLALQSQALLPPLAVENAAVPLTDFAAQIRAVQDMGIFTAMTAPDAPEPERIAVSMMETSAWCVVVARPISQHYLPIRQQIQGTVLLAIVLTGGAFAFSLYFSRRLTYPIRLLTATAEKVSAGDLSARTAVVSQDEIGTLARTFNQMTEELSHIKETLEERVEERTRRLSAANESLQREMSERQRYERQALEFALEHERRRILSEFIQDVSHEFKTPLSIINVKLHLLKRQTTQEQRYLLDGIMEQSHAIAKLIDEMVTMARLDGGVVGKPEHIQLNEFIPMLVINETSAFEAKSIALQTDLGEERLIIEANPEQLWDCIKKVLDNALNYTAEGGEVTIRTRRDGHDARIEIIDSGDGIAEAALPRVFERFYREDEAHTTRGFGLGLPIAKRIVEMYQGTITISSQVSVGTTVTMVFPLID